MHKVGSKGNIGIFCFRLYSCLRGKKKLKPRMHKVSSKGNIGIFCIRLYSCLRGKIHFSESSD